MVAHLPSSNALRAAFTASSTSALSPSATSARTSSFAGLMVSKDFPDFGATHLPPISNLVGECLRKSSAADDFAPSVARSNDGTAAAMINSPRSDPGENEGAAAIEDDESSRSLEAFGFRALRKPI